MKKKFTFFGICVLLCTLMISLGSCQKDYSDDIDDLQEQINQNKSAIAALNSAIANGKIISGVSTVAGGYEITFSDNSTITIMHGTNGADGDDGDDGAVGADGFTPIIGIDADGYWTVITTQGGTPERIKDVDGNEIMAAFSQELGVDNGYLTVGGVATTVKYSTLVFNSVTNTITVTLEDENGNLVTKTLKVAEDTFLANDLTSVVSPIGITKVLIGYSKVGSALTDVHATLGQEGLDFAGVELDEQLKSGGVMPIILNPSNVNTDDYTFEVIKSNGSLFDLQPETITSGYDGAFAQYATGSSNGLFSLNFTPELDDMLAAPPVTKELAVRAVKGDREVVSGYQYEITVAAAGETTFAEKVAGSLTNPVYVAFSTTDNILDLLNRTDVTPVRTLTNGDFYKSELVVVPGSPNEDLNDHIIIDGTTGTAPDATLETVTEVSDKNIDYTLKTFDWKGIYKETDVDIVFYAPLDTEVADIDLGTHVLSDVPAERLLEADLTPMFDALEAEGKVALWQNQARDVKVRIYDENDVNLTGAGFDYFFLDEDGNTFPASPNQALIGVPAISKVVGVEFTVDETTVLPGNYKAVLTFNDRRTYAQGVEFEVEMPFVVENPDLTIDDLTAK
ncbi:MAG: PL29 family lyase N-terminal domain-containing protein, partial [Bacteroidales bacterium]|nr:PL29 family lyase N-terminal domain-containing protein [Bacteroidales bacterium]